MRLRRDSLYAGFRQKCRTFATPFSTPQHPLPSTLPLGEQQIKADTNDFARLNERAGLGLAVCAALAVDDLHIRFLGAIHVNPDVRVLEQRRGKGHPKLRTIVVLNVLVACDHRL